MRMRGILDDFLWWLRSQEYWCQWCCLVESIDKALLISKSSSSTSRCSWCSDNASAWAPQPAGWVGSIERGRVGSAHHAQINEPLQRPQVRRQCILNCRLSLHLYREKLLHPGDEKGPEEEFCGPLNLWGISSQMLYSEEPLEDQLENSEIPEYCKYFTL